MHIARCLPYMASGYEWIKVLDNAQPTKTIVCVNRTIMMPIGEDWSVVQKDVPYFQSQQHFLRKSQGRSEEVIHLLINQEQAVLTLLRILSLWIHRARVSHFFVVFQQAVWQVPLCLFGHLFALADFLLAAQWITDIVRVVCKPPSLDLFVATCATPFSNMEEIFRRLYACQCAARKTTASFLKTFRIADSDCVFECCLRRLFRLRCKMEDHDAYIGHCENPTQFMFETFLSTLFLDGHWESEATFMQDLLRFVKRFAQPHDDMFKVHGKSVYYTRRRESYLHDVKQGRTVFVFVGHPTPVPSFRDDETPLSAIRVQSSHADNSEDAIVYRTNKHIKYMRVSWSCFDAEEMMWANGSDPLPFPWFPYLDNFCPSSSLFQKDDYTYASRMVYLPYTGNEDWYAQFESMDNDPLLRFLDEKHPFCR
jgi:hypothetical protein